MNIEIGNKKIDFVYQGDNLIYPNYPARENLILHYDFSGMKNSDVTKDIARDLSGNGNNGVLQNFAYIDGSGYLDNALIFDGIDDFITIPEPQIDLDNFTYSEGINVLSFRGDNVATVVDGVVEIGGRNLIIGSFNDWRSVTVLKYGCVSAAIPIQDDWRGKTVTHSFEVKDIPEGERVQIRIDFYTAWASYTVYGFGSSVISSGKSKITYEVPSLESGYIYIRARIYPVNYTSDYNVLFRCEKLEFGNKATDWTPAPEDLETTTFKPFFDKKIKSALYWNRALTDEELLQVYNIQTKRI